MPGNAEPGISKTERNAVREVCISHISEIYLFEYYLQPGPYRLIPDDRLKEQMEKGAAEEARGGYAGAVQAYERALELNPVSPEIYLHLIRCLYRMHHLEEMHERTLRMYPFVCTKAELAQYYRWLGCWYLEEYQPELSECVYRYSMLFEKSRQAEEEIRYLETALSAKMPDYSVQEMQNRLRGADIPVHASNVTAALLVKAGEEAEQSPENAWRQQALDCYRMAYDLTADPELQDRIRKLS